MSQTNSKIILFIIGIATVQLAWSLDIENAKEMACTEISKTPSPDLEWMMSVDKWHFLHMSRFNLYSVASDLTKKDPKEINEDEVYYKSCMHWKIKAGNEISYTVYGFGDGKEATYKIKPLDDHFGTYEVSTEEGGSFTDYTTLTDNKSFVFTVLCFKDSNQLAWGVGSPYKSLPNETIQLIHEHAESLGFQREHFTGLRFDSCDSNQNDNAKNEL